MAAVQIRRNHALTPTAARERVGRVADRLAERFGATCRWEQDVLRIEHDSVRGHIALEPTVIVVEAKLGFALSLFRTQLESEIHRILDRELGP